MGKGERGATMTAMDQSGREVYICLATGSDAASAIHGRTWRLPGGGEEAERIAAMLTEAYGAPSEWITDDAGCPDAPRLMLWQENA